MPSEMLRFMEDQKEVNKELREKLDAMAVTLTTNTVILKETHQQTLKTNGRVNKLEAFRNWSTGVLAALGFFWGFIQFIYPIITARREQYTSEQFDKINSLLDQYEEYNHDKK